MNHLVFIRLFKLCENALLFWMIRTGELATISPVLYANVKYPDLKNEFPDWNSRAKQISKLWRKATPDERAPFLVRKLSYKNSVRTSLNDNLTVTNMSLFFKP